jgi:hypothetical protein
MPADRDVDMLHAPDYTTQRFGQSFCTLGDSGVKNRQHGARSFLRTVGTRDENSQNYRGCRMARQDVSRS